MNFLLTFFCFRTGTCSLRPHNSRKHQAWKLQSLRRGDRKGVQGSKRFQLHQLFAERLGHFGWRGGNSDVWRTKTKDCHCQVHFTISHTGWFIYFAFHNSTLQVLLVQCISRKYKNNSKNGQNNLLHFKILGSKEFKLLEEFDELV